MSESAPGFTKHPGYAVDIAPAGQRLVVRLNDVVIADSNRPLAVTETRHHPVYYIPLADVDASRVTATAHSTYCPFKGTASYWSIVADGLEAENAVWGYLDPYTECLGLKDHVAFYPDKVSLELDGKALSNEPPGWTE